MDTAPTQEEEDRVPSRPASAVSESLKLDSATNYSLEMSWDSLYKQKSPKDGAQMKACLDQKSKTQRWEQIFQGFSTYTIVHGLDSDTEYEFRVRFCNQEDEVFTSKETTFRTEKEPVNSNGLQRAIFLQDMNALRNLLQQVESHAILDSPDKTGQSPLMKAASSQYTEAMELLLAAGADPNYSNSAGKTALMRAAYAGHVDTCELLLQHGADLEMRDRGGASALHAACDGSQPFVVHWFLNKGDQVEQLDGNGWTPLLRTAAISGSWDVANMLLVNEADVTCCDHEGKTPLTCAVLNGNQRLVELLLTRGADPQHRDKRGKTPYDIAVALDKPNVLRVLKDFLGKK